MSTPSPPPAPVVAPIVVDTGVLLCAAHATHARGLGLLYELGTQRVIMPAAVHSELARHSRDPQQRIRQQAAMKALGRRASFLVVDSRQFTPAQRQPIRSAVLAAEQQRAQRKGYTPKTGGNDGEVDAILLALQLVPPAVFLSCDHPALDVARANGLEVGSFATVLAASIQRGRGLADDAANECIRLRDANFHVGTHSTSAAELTALYVPPSL